MSAFINTVESVGDAALTRSIIDRSITELNDDITTSIKAHTFRGCSALSNVNFPSVTSVALAAFWDCTALKKADFASCVAFANNAFYGCSALEALILRNTEQISTISGTPFASSAIVSGTGYIYVPAALVDTYKADSSWSTYADQIRAIEDYPEVCDTYTWETVFKCIEDGTYADVYKVGDLVELDLGSEGVVNMQIVAFDADNLADGSGNAPISWISKELLATRHRMNPALVTNEDGTYQEGTGAIGGWEKCEMRTYLNDTILPMIPEDVRGMIKTVTKYSNNVDSSGAVQYAVATADSVWLPSVREVGYTIGAVETKGPKYFSNGDDLKKIPSGSTYANNWWTRSIYKSTAKDSFYEVYSSAQGRVSYDIRYIALGFCT